MSEIEMEGDPNASDGNYEAFPIGEYVLRAQPGSKIEPTKDGARKKIDLTLVVEDGDFQGRKMWHTLTFIPKGEPGHGLTISCLKAFGMLDPQEPSRIRVNATDFDDRTARARVKVEEWPANSKKFRNKIDRWISSDPEPAKEPAAAAAPARAAAPAQAGKPATRAKAPF